MSWIIHEGDCLEGMKGMPENSVDAIVTDPPYLFEFMGKEFDKQHKDLPGENDGQKMQVWHFQWTKEALRVLKPGGYLLAFGGTRTYHRMACAIEDAGFECKDMIHWVTGQGFPKSRDVWRLDIAPEIEKQLRELGVEGDITWK